MRLLAALAVCTVLAQDPKGIVERSLQREQKEDDLARQYAYLETSTEQEWKNGEKSKAESETNEIISLYGQPYRRLVAKNGKPLTAEEQAKEQRKLDKLAEERSKESTAQRERRIAKYQEDRRRQRQFLQKIPQAYLFQMAGETKVANRPVWIIDGAPNPAFTGADSREKMLSKFKARFYITKQDNALLKLEAEAIDTVSFGLILARLDRGARFTLERARVNNELWVPLRIKVDFDAKVALFKHLKVDLQIDYTNFRKFQSESRILPGAP
ncbi:MAG TPA: hypothetical protein VFQ91_15995 [Bryobacteraceae bacterium]|nr:hypothetical protein [Bryobacteraceae bacterium]